MSVEGERCHCESMSACQEGSIKITLMCDGGNNCGQNSFKGSFITEQIKSGK